MSDKKFPYTGFSSLAIHAGHQQDPNYAHLTPIYATSTFVYDDAEQGRDIFTAVGETPLTGKQKKRLRQWKPLELPTSMALP